MTTFHEVAKLIAYVNSYLLTLQPTADLKPFSPSSWSRCLCFKICCNRFRYKCSPPLGGESWAR